MYNRILLGFVFIAFWILILFKSADCTVDIVAKPLLPSELVFGAIVLFIVVAAICLRRIWKISNKYFFPKKEEIPTKNTDQN